MKALVLIALILISPTVYAMGDPYILHSAKNPLSAEERKYLNDFSETTSGINQFAPDRGHQDQQMMEDKEFQRLREEEMEQARELILEKEPPQDGPVDKPYIMRE